MKRFLLSVTALVVTSAFLHAQGTQDVTPMDHMPVYRVVVVARTIPAINYRHRSESTLVNFRPTSLSAGGLGEAEVQSKEGAIRVNARFKHLPPASSFGPEYMTYVLWAISPEGRPVNLGEVLPDRGGYASLNVTSDLQAFGMIVTAEPYFSVTQPSDVVVMENTVTDKTNGTIEQVEAKFDLLRKGQYTTSVNPAEVTPIVVNDRTPIELYEAQNAVRIARWTGARHYAADSLDKAELDLKNAEALISSGGNRKDAITDAREAAQTAEDAREITIRKMKAEEDAQTRQNAADAQAQAAQAQAQASQAQAQAQADQEAAARARAQAEQAQAAQAQADAARQAAEAQAQQAQLQASQADSERAKLRAQLEQQLNSIMQTRDTARGLIMNMSDVLFEFGKYTLKPEAREKLAKTSGILLAYPGLSIEIDGYTDNVGSDEYNQTLSEERAAAVRDYLTSQGVASNAMTSKGFGKTNPIASNDTSQGRQENRRVELVVSGDAIRSQLNSPAAGGR